MQSKIPFRFFLFSEVFSVRTFELAASSEGSECKSEWKYLENMFYESFRGNNYEIIKAYAIDNDVFWYLNRLIVGSSKSIQSTNCKIRSKIRK